jgi:ribosomal protein L23
MSFTYAKHVTSKHASAAPIVTPRVSEKAYAQSQNNVYLFNVPLSFNKQQIASAVAGQFNVTVTNVKTLVQNGKAVRFNRGKRHNPGTTVRSDFKKAYVTLAAGSSIQVFNEQQDAATEESK